MKRLFVALIVCSTFLFAFKSSKEVNGNIVVEAKHFIKENNLDTSMMIYIDMIIHSGKKRMFVFDLKNDSVLLRGLVSHGCGENTWGSDESKTSPKFSNQSNSHCSSLGKYKIGKRGYSNWGINVNYKLLGLESSNSNALSRYIVLHSWEAVTDYEVYPSGTPEGWGCPAVSNNVMIELDKILQNKKDVLLWIKN